MFTVSLLVLIILAASRLSRATRREEQMVFDKYQCCRDDIRHLFNLVPAPMALIRNDDWILVQINRAAADLLATSEGETVGKCITVFFGTNQAEYLAWTQLLRRDAPAEAELPIYRRNGVAIVVAATASINFDGKPHLILSLTDITAKAIRTKTLEKLALTDSMTGLLNRQAFREKLVLALLHFREKKSELCLAFMDLDGLKKVNDTYGHREGDCYINTFVSLLRNYISENDIIGRVGGDEFAIVFTNCSQQVAEDCIRRIQQQLNWLALHTEKPYLMQVSAGVVSVAGGAEPPDADSLLHKADNAMYQQKYLQRRKTQPVAQL
ncbi:sensor domain-containing diguanylate cyclase [Methylomusa anaerophila]|uniref:Putative diguanylate cyclase YeaP n=1 Tax=Methylomusa anaerophila TaxID=1930071 RepID=A0A348AR15_9FIRM|nr:sensor domain-containing diguanylate cyclase [Methylomusa anaerophila]BBB93513.1 putative diguanylate cyclase YeaP [Methylomusa anaerophila]